MTIGRQEEIFDVNVKLGDTFESLRGSCDLPTFPTESVPSPFDCSLTFDKEELFGAEQIFSVSGIFLPERGSSVYISSVQFKAFCYCSIPSGHYACRIKPVDHPKFQFRSSLIQSNLLLTAKVKSFDKDVRIGDCKLASFLLPLEFSSCNPVALQ